MSGRGLVHPCKAATSPDLYEGVDMDTIKLLLVEDNPADALCLKEVLGGVAGTVFAITHMETLTEAQGSLENKDFDAVVLDLGLPDSQGLSTFAQLQHSTPTTPIVVLSALDDEILAKEAVRKGAQDYIVKDKWDGVLLSRSINYAISRKQTEEALRKNEERYRTLLQNIAHQFRQPLAIIGGFARRTAKEAESSDKLDAQSIERSSRIITQEVHRLEQILNELIDFTHRESVRLESVNPNEMIEYVLDMNRTKLEEKNLRVHTRLGIDIDDIPLEPDRFQQVVRNLIANAIEASPVDAVISIETRATIPGEEARQNGKFDSHAYFEMRIHNFGQGIPPEDMERIFDPFFTTKGCGTGMGLTLARKIVEDHGGSLSLKSDKAGTIATVCLPVWQVTEIVTTSLQ
jgi:signal transduction histidine kinase